MKSNSQFFERLQPLLDKALEGSPAALNHLIAFCLPNLKVHARQQIGRALKGQVEPSDLVQLTCLKAARRIHGFRGRTARRFWNWLRRIQRNQLIDWARKAKKKPQAMNPNDVPSGTEPPQIDPLPTPKTLAINKEQAEVVRAALARLPAHYRNAVQLRCGEKLTFLGISDRLGMSSEAAARACYNRAVELLKIELRSLHDS